MKILISSNSSWNIFNFRINLVKSLLKKGYKIVIVTPLDSYTEKITSLGCEFIPINFESKSLSPIKNIILIFKYFLIIRKIKPDFYLGFTIKPNIYGSMVANYFKINVINNISGLGTSFLKRGFLNILVKYLYKFSLKNSKKILFQNKDDLELFVKSKIIKQNRTLLIPGSGVDLNKFKYSEPNESEFIKFLFIGRLIYHKGIREIFQASQNLKSNYPKVKFQFLGFIDNDNKSSISRKKLNNYIEEGVIEYLGETDNVIKFIKDSDCVLLPSYREGMPKSLLEASAIGRPIIGSDSPGCKHLIQDGQNGFICKSRDSDSLTKILIKFISLDTNKRKEMGKKAYNYVVENFDENIIINEYITLLMDLNKVK